MSEKKRLLPTHLGKYTIQNLIGRGKRTEVYRASGPDGRGDVAIKVYLSDVAKSAELVACFRQTVQTVAALKHPNLLRIYDFGIEHDTYYVVTELVEGTTLRDLLSTHPTGLGRDDTLRLFSQIASALSYAHDQNIFHINLKPESILLDASSRPVLADFDIPCLRPDAVQPAEDVNTATYMAPEQAAVPPGPATVQRDVYILGVLLYEMVTGDVPFKGDTPAHIIKQHVETAPIPPGQISPGLDPRFEAVILKALHKTPAARYASAREMMAELERHEEVSLFETLALERPPTQRVRRRRSEISRFESSRTDWPSVSPGAAPKDSSAAVFQILVFGLVAALLVTLAAALIILLA